MTEAHYRNAPIVEAVIDFRVKFGSEPTFDALKRFATQLKDQFPTQHEFQQVQLNLTVTPKASKATKKPLQSGFKLTSADGKRVLTIQQAGFAYSHLAPYTNWRNFRAEAEALWPLYRSSFKPTSIVRYAVRFINKITTPGGWDARSSYLSLTPSIPEGMSGPVNAYFMQLQLPQPQIAPTALLIVNSGLGESEKQAGTAFMLDFDLFVTEEMAANSEDIWQKLDVLRARKNEVFEACITPQTRGMIS